jgi:hypothetical protein
MVFIADDLAVGIGKEILWICEVRPTGCWILVLMLI